VVLFEFHRRKSTTCLLRPFHHPSLWFSSTLDLLFTLTVVFEASAVGSRSVLPPFLKIRGGSLCRRPIFVPHLLLSMRPLEFHRIIFLILHAAIVVDPRMLRCPWGLDCLTFVLCLPLFNLSGLRTTGGSRDIIRTDFRG